jgi:aminoglycoside 6'-N-acetyltransferase I
MAVRPYQPWDEDQLRVMARALLPDEPDYDFSDEQLFVWDEGGGLLGGFASVSVRPWSDASRLSPAPHIEAWYVLPQFRRRGIGALLIGAVEEWCRICGFSELGSDAELDNAVSLTAHQRLGFEPGLRIQYFKKLLS